MKDELSLNTCCVLSALERGGEKCFIGIWDVYNVDVVYFLMYFYEPKKKITLPIFGRSVILEKNMLFKGLP